MPISGLAVAPGQAGNDGTGATGIRHPADATNQRGVSETQAHGGAAVSVAAIVELSASILPPEPEPLRDARVPERDSWGDTTTSRPELPLDFRIGQRIFTSVSQTDQASGF
jgi:hypothetical protein